MIYGYAFFLQSCNFVNEAPHHLLWTAHARGEVAEGTKSPTWPLAWNSLLDPVQRLPRHLSRETVCPLRAYTRRWVCASFTHPCVRTAGRTPRAHAPYALCVRTARPARTHRTPCAYAPLAPRARTVRPARTHRAPARTHRTPMRAATSYR